MMTQTHSRTGAKAAANIRLLVLIFCSFPILASAQHLENTLCWRISGNGLQQPSFLYGTMHLQDRRIFQFTDSVYYYLQQAEGFAMEVHPDSLSKYILEQSEKQAHDRLVKDIMDKKSYAKLKRKLEKDFHVKADSLSVDEAYALNRKRVTPQAKENDMQTFVDMFLYGLARQRNKLISGLEPIEDQMAILDDARESFDPSELLTEKQVTDSILETMIRLYANQDMDSIANFMDYLPEQLEDRLMTRRNLTMLHSIDSLVHRHSYFVAVGAAHLLGNQGLIALLRQKGYTVSPVISSKHIDAATIQQTEVPWVEVRKPVEGYRVNMPDAGSEIELNEIGARMQFCYDLVTMKVYYCMHVKSVLSVTEQNADSIINAIMENVNRKSNGQELSRKKLNRTDCLAYEAEVFMVKEKLYGHMQILFRGKDVYLLMGAGQKKEAMHDAQTTRFMNSFAFIEREKHETAWTRYEPSGVGFSASFPGVPREVQIRDDESSSAIQHLCTDANTGAAFAVVSEKLKPTYLFQDDSLYKAAFLTNLQNIGVDSQFLQVRDTMLQGYSSFRFSAKLNGFDMDGLVVDRLTRAYTAYVVYKLADSEQVRERDRFLQNFRLLPYDRAGWSVTYSPDSCFATWAPASFTRERKAYLPDSLQQTREGTVYSYDSCTGASYFVGQSEMDPFQWANSDSSLLRARLGELMTDIEQPTVLRMINEEGVSILEYQINKRKAGLRRYGRLLRNGRWLISLYTDVDTTLGRFPDLDRFMKDFRILPNARDRRTLQSSAAVFLDALAAGDSTLRDSARSGIYRLHIPAEDYSSVLKRLMLSPDSCFQTYGFDQREFMLRNFNFKPGPELLSAALQLYPALDSAGEKMRYPLLELMTRCGDAGEDSALKRYDAAPPRAGNPASFIDHFGLDNKNWRKSYPLLLKHCGDSLSGIYLFPLHASLLDSGYISVSDVKPYEADLFRIAALEYANTSSDTGDHFQYQQADLYRVLMLLNKENGMRWLRKFAALPGNLQRDNAAVLLAGYGYAPDKKIMEQIAADNRFRISFYDQLKEKGKANLFPAKYATQQYMGESLLYNSFEDEVPSNIEFVALKTITFMGKPARFYLFRVSLDEGDSTQQFLGVSGPFDTAGKLLKPEGYYTNCYFDEPFQSRDINKQFAAFIKSLEDQEPENDGE